MLYRMVILGYGVEQTYQFGKDAKELAAEARLLNADYNPMWSYFLRTDRHTPITAARRLGLEYQAMKNKHHYEMCHVTLRALDVLLSENDSKEAIESAFKRGVSRLSEL